MYTGQFCRTRFWGYWSFCRIQASHTWSPVLSLILWPGLCWFLWTGNTKPGKTNWSSARGASLWGFGDEVLFDALSEMDFVQVIVILPCLIQDHSWVQHGALGQCSLCRIFIVFIYLSGRGDINVHGIVCFHIWRKSNYPWSSSCISVTLHWTKRIAGNSSFAAK